VSSADYRTGLALVTASAVAWSTTCYFTQLIPLDTWTVLAWRGVIGTMGIAVVIIILQRGRGVSDFLHLGRAGWLFALVSGGAMICFIFALRHTTVAHVAVIYASVPFFAAMLAWILIREAPTKGAVRASLIAFAGVVVMVGFGREGSFSGDLLAFAMTMALALMMVIARQSPGLPVMQAACLSALLSGLVCWPFGAHAAVTDTNLLLLALFGLVNSALGMVLFTLGARRLPAIETALIGALYAPLAPLWVWIAFGETPGFATLIGGLIVFIAVATHVTLSARSTEA
jgi:drug/metabolite transporter (DMT)-like permease